MYRHLLISKSKGHCVQKPSKEDHQPLAWASIYSGTCVRACNKHVRHQPMCSPRRSKRQCYGVLVMTREGIPSWLQVLLTAPGLLAMSLPACLPGEFTSIMDRQTGCPNSSLLAGHVCSPGRPSACDPPASASLSAGHRPVPPGLAPSSTLLPRTPEGR